MDYPGLQGRRVYSGENKLSMTVIGRDDICLETQETSPDMIDSKISTNKPEQGEWLPDER